jgi:Rha family phage regulatory protein
MTKSLIQINVANNRPTTTSLNVAEVFGKKHHHVMAAIKDLEITQEERETNFRLLSYSRTVGQGAVRQYPYYEMTRSGFTWLVMGFTGKKAMRFKVAYTNEFDRMEEYIRNQQQQPATLPEGDQLIEQAFLLARSRMLTAEAQVKELEPKAEAYDKFLSVGKNQSLQRAMSIVGVPQVNKGIDLMREKGVLFTDPWNGPCAYMRVHGYATTRAHEKGSKTLIAPRGLDFLNKLFNKHGRP